MGDSDEPKLTPGQKVQAIWFACFIVLLLAGAIGAAWDSCQPKTPTLEEKAEEGDAEAQSMLGFEYELKQDLKEAAKWYRKAAEQGIANKQFRLGVMYFYGNGVEKDLKEAAKWCRKAADQGHAGAQNTLGKMYSLGQGVPKDAKEAAKWYRKAAEQGIADAQFRLGVAYANGEGVLEDTLAAYAWYNIAAANGDDSAKGLKDIITKEMTPEQIAEAQKLSREIIAKNPKLIGD